MKKYILSVMIFLMLITGCGSMADSGKLKDVLGMPIEESEEDNREKVMEWSCEHVALNDLYEVSTVRQGKVYGCAYTAQGFSVSVWDIAADRELRRIDIIGGKEVQNISTDDAGNICLFGIGEGGHTLWTIDPAGMVSSRENIDIEDLGHEPVLKGVYADSKGYTYFWYTMEFYASELYEGGSTNYAYFIEKIYVKDSNMDTVFVEEWHCLRDGNIVAVLFNESDTPTVLINDDEGYYTREIRTKAGKEPEIYRIEGVDFLKLRKGSRIFLSQGSLYYVKEGTLYQFHLEDGATESVLELAGFGIYEEDILYIDKLGDTIEIVDNFWGSDHSEYTCLRPGKGKQTTITLGVMMMQPSIRNLIADFNRSQDTIRIEPVIYAENYDFNAGQDRLKMDILQEKAPDLLFAVGIDEEILAKVGAFQDLYELMDKDPECSRDKFVTSVLKSYETGDKLYTISPNFCIWTIWGPESIVKGRSGVRMSELMDILRENGGTVDSIYGFYGDENVLRTLCHLGLNQYIQWDEKTCDFRGQEFRDLLAFVKSRKGKHYDSLYEAHRNHDFMLTIGQIRSVEDYCLQSKMYGEKIQFLGFPTSEGTGSVADMWDRMAINAKSQHMQEAWTFLKYYLFHGYQYDPIGFPLVREQYEEALVESTREDKMTDETGQAESVPKTSYVERDVVSLLVYKAEAEDVQAVRELVDSASGQFIYCEAIHDIMDEEAEAYFRDQKTVDQVIDLIQNRVQLYLNE